MRRLVFMFALLGLLAFSSSGNPAAAEEELPLHPHMLLQRPEFGLIDEVPHLIGVRKCVDLAGNRSVPIHAHHEQLHFGDSGVSFGGQSGHAVIPTSPLAPWSNCEDFLTFLPLPLQ